MRTVRRKSLFLSVFILTAFILSHVPSETAVRPLKQSYAPDEPIEIVYDNLPGSQTDWISLAPRENADDRYGEWFYTGGMRSGSHTFGGLPAGVYEARVYHDWPAGGYVVQERAAVFVQEAVPEQSGPVPAEIPAAMRPTPRPEPHPSPVPEPVEISWSASGQGTLFAPGQGVHNYRIHELDARRFLNGGTLIVDVRIGAGQSWASVDLYGDGQSLATSGVSQALASAWDLPPNSNRRITHTFRKGQIFRLCFEGNWGSPQGATNTYTYSATIKPAPEHEPQLPPLPERETPHVAPPENAVNRRAAETLWRQAVSFQQQKRYEEALAKYREGLALSEDPAVAHHADAMETCLLRLSTLPDIAATRPEAAEIDIFNNWNKTAVVNNPAGPPSPTRFTISRPHAITYINTYHYFNNGTPAGSITLVHQDGTLYGPWPATGRSGQGGVQNAIWEATPQTTLKAGTYTVFDSHPSTWSHNAQSDLRGFALVKGRLLQ